MKVRILTLIMNIGQIPHVISGLQRSGGGRGGGEFPGAKYFLPRYIWNHKIGVKLLHENSIWDLHLFIKEDISDKT